MEMLAEIIYPGPFGSCHPYEEIAVAGVMEEARGQRSISVWLCFALQVLVDINRTTGSVYLIILHCFFHGTATQVG